MTDKPILCLDFDGVLHSYSSGWQGVDAIPDPPVDGALAFLRDAVEHFRVAIYSSRSSSYNGRRAMREWLGYWSVDPTHGLPPGTELAFLGDLEWPVEKPAAIVTIDDRGLTFDGTWPSIETLKAFKPWNKKASGDGIPDPAHATVDAHGVVWHEFACSFTDQDGKLFAFNIWARDADDAERRMVALRDTAKVDGKVYKVFPA